MKVDHTTLADLSVFNNQFSLFHKLDFATTTLGSSWLKNHLYHPPSNYNDLLAIQEAVRCLYHSLEVWPEGISNGTVLMATQFFTAHANIGLKPTRFSVILDKLWSKVSKKSNLSAVTFSINHIIIFVHGCFKLLENLKKMELPHLLDLKVNELALLLEHPMFLKINAASKTSDYYQLTLLSYEVRRTMKYSMQRLFDQFAFFDGVYALALATKNNNWNFPELHEKEKQQLVLSAMRHPLLEKPVSYDISFNKEQPFLFLTGANMSGKSTFIRTLGTCVYLAHLGVGVPASKAVVSYLEHLITNMHVQDDIFKGESYFFAEVKRMRLTAEKIASSSYNLVLMDELFKGTNVHDAYECSKAVIEALLGRHNNMYALSTHLYELYDHFKHIQRVNFRYCATEVDENGDYIFTYQLKEGVSNDKIGYWVLEKEGVLKILQDFR